MLLIALLFSFFVGAIPFGVFIGKMRGIDVRAAGSGNIGATNVWRLLGPKAGTAAFILDVSKGVVGVVLGHLLLKDNEVGIALCGIAAVLGHSFSPFLGFKGGKGIATSLGALLALMPLVGVLCFVIWGVMLGLTRMVSVASVVACVALPFMAFYLQDSKPFFVVALLMGIIAFVKHIPNLKRVAAGTEPKVGQKKSAAVV